MLMEEAAPILIERPNGATDEELLYRVCRKDRCALEGLAQRHTLRALALVRYMGCRPGEDEDLVQQAWLLVWQRAEHGLSTGMPFANWFFGIIVKICTRWDRDTVKGMRQGVLDVRLHGNMAPSLGEHRFVAARIFGALDAMPAKSRAAMALCHYLNQPSADAANILGTTARAVEDMLFRARRIIGSALDVPGVADRDLDALLELGRVKVERSAVSRTIHAAMECIDLDAGGIAGKVAHHQRTSSGAWIWAALVCCMVSAGLIFGLSGS